MAKAQNDEYILSLEAEEIDSRLQNMILSTKQELTEEQKLQARRNIGAASLEEVMGGKKYIAYLTNKLESAVFAVAKGSEAVLQFTYTSADLDGVQDGPGAAQIFINDIARKSFLAQQNQTIVQHIEDYLSLGINNVVVKVSNSEGSEVSLRYTITVASVTISSPFDSAEPCQGEYFEFRYKVTGSGDKTVYFKIDNDIITSTEVSSSGEMESIDLRTPEHGGHILRVWAICEVDGLTVPSNVLEYGIIAWEEGNDEPVIVVINKPANESPQYANVLVTYRVYHKDILELPVELKVNGEVVNSLQVGRKIQSWSYRPAEKGQIIQTIQCGDISESWTVEIVDSDIKAEAVTKNLDLYLTAIGRSNQEKPTPAVWKSGDVSAKFNNFNFTSDGWRQEKDGSVLRITGNARLEIPYRIFETDFAKNGKTLEFEIATREVLSYDAEVLSCFSEGKGFKITAQQLIFASEQSSLNARYKEDEHIRVSIVTEGRTEDRLLICYINGIMTSAVQYPTGDNFQQGSPVDITIGSNECTIDLYNIRVYNGSLTRRQILNNWIADTQDYTEKSERDERNNLYTDYGAISIDKLPRDLPYLTIYGSSLPQFKGDKKTVDCSFTNPEKPEYDFTANGVQIDVQGTSSQYYAVKNFKIKAKNGFVNSKGEQSEVYSINENAVPTNVFTMKADVASSEGAFNVVLAQLYNDLCPYKTPAQKKNPKVRQCIDGFPIVIFWVNSETNETEFLGKYNFNNDKGTSEVFGFEEGDESWEIRQNGTPRVGWHSDDFTVGNWENDFEARYPEDNKDYSKHLQALSTWLASTDTAQATNIPITPVTYGDTTYSTDSKEYRLAKFSNELSEHFVEEAIIFYYLFTEIFLSIDQREKNAFPTYLKDEGKWIVLFYDADSSLGTDNKGKLTFDYYLEDIDYTEGGDPIYNGQNSVLWQNLRETRAEQIQKMYQDFRINGQIDYDWAIGAFENHQGKWPEAVFNEDMYKKYIATSIRELTEDEKDENKGGMKEGDYLTMLQGKKEQWMKWWLYNRFRYLDSKYEIGTSKEKTIWFRPRSTANVTLSSYLNMYGHVRYNEDHICHRLTRGVVQEFTSKDSSSEDRVVTINDADMISTIGDLSTHQVETIDISKATRLTGLKIGDGKSTYKNTYLSSVSLGNNKLLRVLDLRNCVNYTSTIQASNCSNIEEVLLDGTATTGVELPDGGILKRLSLPGTITNLTIRNQPYLSEVSISTYDNLTTLWLEKIGSVLNPVKIVNKMKAGSRIRLIGIDCTIESTDELYRFADKLDSCNGIDENGLTLSGKAVISGTIRTNLITKELLNHFNTNYPNVTIAYTGIGYLVKFMNGDEVFSRSILPVGQTIVAPGDPIRESTLQYRYIFKGWSTDGVNVVTNLGYMASADKTFKAVFEQQTRKYTISFYQGDKLLQSTAVEYGLMPEYTGATPTEDRKIFAGWDPEITVVTGDMRYFAVFTNDSDLRRIMDRYIKSYTNDKVTKLGPNAFVMCTSLEELNLPNVTTIGQSSIQSTGSLKKVNFPNLEQIGDSAFHGCGIPSIELPKVTSIGYGSFRLCSKLESIKLPENPPRVQSNSFNEINSSVTFIVPIGALKNYENDASWRTFIEQFNFIEEEI